MAHSDDSLNDDRNGAADISSVTGEPQHGTSGDEPHGKKNDPAMEALSEAMRLSFVLLRILMVLFVALFLLTGIDTVESAQKGIVKVFGVPVRVVGPGIVFNWPYPAGEVEKVGTEVRTLPVDDFWFEVKEGDASRDLSEMGFSAKGLRPGWDGYMLTGDRNIVHMEIVCRYRIENALAYVRHVTDPEKVMRTAICDAVVQAAATRRSDALLRDPTSFQLEVKERVQKRLDRLMDTETGHHGIRIGEIQVERKTWPLAAFDAYEEAQKAEAKKRGAVDKAKSEARGMTGVVGETAFITLVGEPWKSPVVVYERTTEPLDDPRKSVVSLVPGRDAAADGIRPYNLLGRIETAEKDGRNDEAAALRAAAEALLDGYLVSGDVRAAIENAEAERKKIVQRAKARSILFTRLQSAASGGGSAALKDKLWLDLMDEVMSDGFEKKFILHRGSKVLYISEDPDVSREIREARRKRDTD